MTEVYFVEKYGNEFGTTPTCNAVFKGIQDKEDQDSWTVLEPVGCTEMLLDVYKKDVIVIDKNIAKVGFYTSSSFFKLMKSIGADKILNDKTREWLEGLPRDSCKTTITWYSDGLKLNKGMNPPQTELF